MGTPLLSPAEAKKKLAKIDAEIGDIPRPIAIGRKLAEAKLLYEILHPETRSSRQTGGGKKRDSPFKAFVVERVERTKKGRSWIEKHLKIVTDIPANLLDALDASSIGEQWTTLADLSSRRPKERQREIARLVISDPTIKYKDAVRRVEAEYGREEPRPVEPVVGERVHLLPTTWEKITKEIAAESVDAIVSDIDWSEETIGKIDAFATFCDRVLRPRGRIVLLTGQATGWRVETAFRKKFSFNWSVAYLAFREARPSQLRGGRSAWYPILVFGKKGTRWPYECPDVFRETEDPWHEGTDHQFAKGLTAFLDIIEELTPPGGTVLDPFAGSGTTGVAAILQGRRFIGIERDQRNFRMASDRLDAAVQAREDMEWEKSPEGLAVRREQLLAELSESNGR